MYLGHQTNPNITTIYNILNSGYLKSGYETNKNNLYGKGEKHNSKFIYLMFYDITETIPHFELNIDLLLDNVSYLNLTWYAKINNKSIKIDGKKTDKKTINKIITKYRNDIKKQPILLHEILIRHDIDLTKYLRKITIFKKSITNAPNTYNKMKILLKKKYPTVKVKII